MKKYQHFRDLADQDIKLAENKIFSLVEKYSQIILESFHPPSDTKTIDYYTERIKKEKIPFSESVRKISQILEKHPKLK